VGGVKRKNKEAAMRTRLIDLAVVLGTAAVAAAVFGTLLAPEVTVAEDDPFVSMLVGRPRAMEANGVKLRVDLGDAVRGPGRCAPLELTATNAVEQERILAVIVQITSVKAPSPFSRGMPLPETVWTGKVEAKVAPGRTTRIALSPDVTVSANTTVGVNLIVGDRTVRAAGFTVRGNAPAAALPVEKQAG